MKRDVGSLAIKPEVMATDLYGGYAGGGALGDVRGVVARNRRWFYDDARRVDNVVWKFDDVADS